MKTQVFEQLLIEDSKILKELSLGEKDHKKILDIYALRVNLYKDYAKKSVVMSDMGLLAAQFEIQYTIAKIKLRLEELELKSGKFND